VCPIDKVGGKIFKLFVRVVDEVHNDVLVRVRANWEVVATHVDWLGAR
jgi:hypothetical protein